jgi:hypothetical protein
MLIHKDGRWFLAGLKGRCRRTWVGVVEGIGGFPTSCLTGRGRSEYKSLKLVNYHDKRIKYTPKRRQNTSNAFKSFIYTNTYYISTKYDERWSFISSFTESFTSSFIVKNRPFHRKKPLSFTMVIIFYKVNGYWRPLKGESFTRYPLIYGRFTAWWNIWAQNEIYTFMRGEGWVMNREILPIQIQLSDLRPFLYLSACSTTCREDPLGLPSAAWVQSQTVLMDKF